MSHGYGDCEVGSYEAHCRDYAIWGDPMRDAYDYEAMADYDRWDGHRGDLLGVDCDGWENWETYFDYQDFCEYQDRMSWEASFSCADNEDHAACLAGEGVVTPR